MKKFIPTLFFGLFILASTLPVKAVLAEIQSQQITTLAEAVEFGLQNNPQTHIALQRRAHGRAMTESAGSFNLPMLSLHSSYSQTTTPMNSFGTILNQGEFDNSIDFNDPGRTDDLMLKAKLSYRIYDGGATDGGIALAEANSMALDHQLAVVNQQLAFEIVKSYHTIVQSREMLHVRQKAIEAISASLAVGTARYEVGDLLKEDLLNLELQRARAVEDQIRSRHLLELSERIFWNLLGLESSADMTIPALGREQDLPTIMDYTPRRELQAIDARVRGAEAALIRVESGDRPALNTFAQYQLNYGTELDGSDDSWMAGISMDYALYDGNRTESDIVAAKAKIMEAKSEKDKLLLSLSLEIQRAEISYQQSLERLQVTEKMVSVATESAQLSRSRFQQGVILASDLIDVEMRLTDARARRAAATAEHRISIANLRRATGNEQFAVK